MINKMKKIITIVLGLITISVSGNEVAASPSYHLASTSTADCSDFGTSGALQIDSDDCMQFYNCKDDHTAEPSFPVRCDDEYKCFDPVTHMCSDDTTACKVACAANNPTCYYDCASAIDAGQSLRADPDPNSCDKRYYCGDPFSDGEPVKSCEGDTPYFNGHTCVADEKQCCKCKLTPCTAAGQLIEDKYDCHSFYICVELSVGSGVYIPIGNTSCPNGEVFDTDHCDESTYDCDNTCNKVRHEVVPETCTTTSGETGTCYTSSDCTAKDGVTDGAPCNDGNGVCCMFEYECESTVTSNDVSYLVNDGYPDDFDNDCQYIINKPNKDVCQLRLDLVEFTLGQPDADSLCKDDRFTAAVDGEEIITICGENEGQHMYLDVSGPDSVAAIINIKKTGSGVISGRKWKIRVTQIACSDSEKKAPMGCLQYHYEALTSGTGSIESFNYGQIITAGDTRQLSDMNYAICIPVKQGYCSIKYTNEGDFSLTKDKNTAVDQDIGDPECNTDYIVIPGVDSPDSTYAVDRFCGTKLDSTDTITTYATPFIVRLVTDGNEGSLSYVGATPDSDNIGFKLKFEQLLC